MPELDKDSINELSYEEIVVKLNDGMKLLESGNLTLEQSIALYKECMTMIKKCNEILDNAEIVIKDITDPS